MKHSPWDAAIITTMRRIYLQGTLAGKCSTQNLVLKSFNSAMKETNTMGTKMFSTHLNGIVFTISTLWFFFLIKAISQWNMYKNIHGICHSVASNLENSMSQKKNGRYITFSKHFLAIVFIIPLYIACLIRMSHGNVFPRIKYYLLLTCTSSSWH